ncbi:MAG: hypothetical protein ACOCXM_08945 [Myxococcota bacterium]
MPSKDAFSFTASPATRRVLVVRPYGDRIRNRVFQVLERAGWSSQDCVPTGTDDEEAVRWVLHSPTRSLLVPFHGHRLDSGQSVDGLRFLLRLHQAAGGSFRWRVLMPYSHFAAPAVDLLVASHDFERDYPKELRDALMLLSEDDLEDAGLPARIAAHLSSHDVGRR